MVKELVKVMIKEVVKVVIEEVIETSLKEERVKTYMSLWRRGCVIFLLY